jgi:predicted transcriptional regulator
MSVNISKLKKERTFENEKIKISFSTGDVSNSFSVYIKDENGKNHHILWEISPDRCHQNFDKTNEKIKSFVKEKINEWVNEEEEAERKRNEAIQNRVHREENDLRKLMESF